MFFFFFSSRRRHTRSLCDWSSDVCSSDLAILTSMSRASRELVVRIAEMDPRRRASIDKRLHFSLCVSLLVAMIGGAVVGYLLSEALGVSSHTLGFIGLVLGLLLSLGSFVLIRFAVFRWYLSRSPRRRSGERAR